MTLNDQRLAVSHELSGDTPADLRYYKWLGDVEALMGITTLDGDYEADGYSLDHAAGLYKNLTPARDAAYFFIMRMKERQK